MSAEKWEAATVPDCRSVAMEKFLEASGRRTVKAEEHHDEREDARANRALDSALR